MADVHDPETRSHNMSRIRGKDTHPELLVRKYLFGKGFRYRLHDKQLPGKPDIVLKKYKTVIFIHGCFWHGHQGCKYFKIPETNTDWWAKKIESNRERDEKNISSLINAKWNVFVIFECDLKVSKQEITLQKLSTYLNELSTLKKDEQA